MRTRIAGLFGMDVLPLPRDAALILLLIAGATAGLIAREPASAQTSKSVQDHSTEQIIFDAHSGEYHRWLNQDVRWIITQEEKKAFIGLSNDKERDEFIRQFWIRRNPNPDSVENRFKEEHYRRLAYASARFAAKEEPGWKTDRGRVYIVFGPPHFIDSHPASGPEAEKPIDIWHYRSIRLVWPELDPWIPKWKKVQTAVIKDFDFNFVDECACGQYRLESPWPSAESGTNPQ